MRSSLKALSAGIVSFTALAACSTITPTDDPVYLRIQDLEARLMRIERVVNNESLIELAGQIEQMRADVSALRGEVETLRFETESSGDRQRELYLDIDRRLESLELSRAGLPGAQSFNAGPSAEGADAPVPGAALSPGAGGAPAAARPSGNAQEGYAAAFELLQARRYEDAARAFRQFVQDFPDSDLAANAQYWLAETLYVRQQFDAALTEFEKVLELYPRWCERCHYCL